MASDIGSQPRRWGGVELNAGDKQWFYFRPGDPPPHFDPTATDYVGKHKGMRQVCYERGWYVDGMTAHGEASDHVPENPDAWQPRDLVIRNEDVGGGNEERFLYRVVTIPADHSDVESDDLIQCEHLVLKQWKGIQVYKPSGKMWNFAANTLTSVSRGAYKVVQGKLKNKKTLGVEFDLNAYWSNLQSGDAVSTHAPYPTHTPMHTHATIHAHPCTHT